MLLDLSKIIQTPDSELPFRTELDLHDLEFGGNYPVQEPVLAEGSVRNTAGVLVLRGTVSTRLHAVCDRCAAEFLREVSYPVQAVLVYKEEKAELDEILTTTFVLNMDTKLLCRPDCKGLCCRCGKNLNDGPCGCRPEVDPRLAVLGQLLKDKK